MTAIARFQVEAVSGELLILPEATRKYPRVLGFLPTCGASTLFFRPNIFRPFPSLLDQVGFNADLA